MKHRRSLIAIVCAALASLFLSSCWTMVKYGCPDPDIDKWEDIDDNPADTTITEPTDSTDIDLPNDSTEIPE